MKYKMNEQTDNALPIQTDKQITKNKLLCNRRDSIHCPRRELTPVISNHRREDREGIQDKEDHTEHRHNRSHLKQIRRGEGLRGVCDEVGRRGGRKHKRATTTTRNWEEEGERIELSLDSHTNYNRNHDGSTGRVGHEDTNDYHENGDNCDSEILDMMIVKSNLPG